MTKDQQGLTLAGTRESARAFDRAIADYYGLTGDPVGILKQALARDAEFALGGVAIAALYMIGGFRGDHAEVVNALAAAQPAIRSLEHQAGALIAFQLPVQPSYGNAAELATVWLTIGATMSDSFFITSEYRNGRDALEIVVSICKGDVLSIAADVCHRRMERF